MLDSHGVLHFQVINSNSSHPWGLMPISVLKKRFYYIARTKLNLKISKVSCLTIFFNLLSYLPYLISSYINNIYLSRITMKGSADRLKGLLNLAFIN